MNWYVVIGVILLVLVFGSIAALAWWNLAAKMAPYEDEQGSKKRKPAAKHDENAEVVPWYTTGAAAGMMMTSMDPAIGRPSDAAHEREANAGRPAHDARASDAGAPEKIQSTWSEAPDWNDSPSSDSSGSYDSGSGSSSSDFGGSDSGSSGSSD